MASWPASLPVISSLEGYGFEPVDSVLRTEMEGGIPKSRRRYSQTISKFHVSIPMSRAELAAFETFHQYTLNGGASWFDMPLVNGQGTTVCQALINGAFRATRASATYWTVAFEMWVRNRPVAAP